MKNTSQHKYRFGVTGKPLKSFFSRRKVKEHRNFPKGFIGTWEYVKAYFELNNYFVGVENGKRESY